MFGNQCRKISLDLDLHFTRQFIEFSIIYANYWYENTDLASSPLPVGTPLDILTEAAEHDVWAYIRAIFGTSGLSPESSASYKVCPPICNTHLIRLRLTFQSWTKFEHGIFFSDWRVWSSNIGCYIHYWRKTEKDSCIKCLRGGNDERRRIITAPSIWNSNHFWA